MNKLDSNSKTILGTCIVAALIVICVLIFTAPPAKAGTAMPLPTATPDYPIVCSDSNGRVTLVADGVKVRVAYWTDETPYFTDSRPVSRHKRTFKAPAGSVCRVPARSEESIRVDTTAARG